MNKKRKFSEIDKALIEYGKSLAGIEKTIKEEAVKTSREARSFVETLRQDLYNDISRWECLEIARHPGRPGTCEYISTIFDGFMELHGDRMLGDDKALTGGIAFLNDSPVIVIGHKKHSAGQKDYIEHHNGMASPSGNNKAARLLKLAEKFNRPVITFVDTPGAYPDPEAEDRGQAFSIARCIETLATVKIPVISCIIGEAGSGGALALAFGDRIIMLENSFFSSISPEGFASIKRGDEISKEAAAEILKGTGSDLYALGIVDNLIKEPVGGAHNDPESVIKETANAISHYIDELSEENIDELMHKRALRIQGLR
jgi:acetyl-CoA carboxylase carboxyl transferase subunit alpha